MDNTDHDVVITGIGPVSSIGIGKDALWTSLAAGRSNVSVRRLPTDLGVTVDLPMASMPPMFEVDGLERHLVFLDSQDCPGYRDLAYAMLAVELALADARLDYDRDTNTIGVVQAFEAPGVERVVGRLFEMMIGPLPTDGPPRVYEHLAPFFYASQPFFYVHLLGKAFHFHGYSTSVHNACSSGAFAIEEAAGRIRSGQADIMIVVGGEAFDTAVRLEWFRRLELYAHDDRMRPFDKESSGFYVGEGAAAIVMESAAHAAQRGATVYARYLGGGFAQQSWKQTIPDIRANRLRGAIETAMSRAGVSSDQLDLIVPHGAGTVLSDGYESMSIQQTLRNGGRQAVATVFKPYVGHLLACSVIIEMICALLAMEHQAVPATLHTHPDRVTLPIPLATATSERPINTILKLSTGFTGHDAATIFERPTT